MGLTNQIPSSRLVQPGVCTSSTRPASPFEGQCIFETDTDKLLVWNGTAWVMPNKPAQNPDGLELVTTATCTSGGTASNGVITIGSAVSSVVVANAFSSTYDNYKVTYQMGDCSAVAAILYLKFNNSTGSTYSYGGGYTLYGTATFVAETENNTSNGIRIGNVHADLSSCVAEIISPFLTTPTHVTSQHADAQYFSTRGGRDSNVASQTGFSLYSSSGTMTGGTIRIYGFRNS